MAARRMVVEAGPPGTATVATQQIGRDAALVEKHVLGGIVQRQPGPPLAALRGDVRPTLFVGVNRFFSA